MIRKIEERDSGEFLEMIDAFYHSSAVLHPVDSAHSEVTLKEALKESPYIDIFIIENENQIVGYIQNSITWSNEAGGITVWIEELFIKDKFRGKGFGSKAIEFIMNYYKNASRFRLEIEPDNKRAAELYKRYGFDFLNYKQMTLDFGIR